MSTANVEPRWSDTGVKSAITSEIADTYTRIKDGEQILSTFANLALTFKNTGRDNEASVVRGAAQGIIRSIYDLHVHREALQLIGHSYQPTGESTDFLSLLDSHKTTITARTPFNINDDPLMKQFDEDSGMGGEHGDQQIDDDIAIAGTSAVDIARNEKCPISGKSIMDLEEPVSDSMNVVYEKQAIMNYFKTSKRDRVACPLAATAHFITKAELKPARAVIQAQKRAAKNVGTQAQAGNNDDEVLEL